MTYRRTWYVDRMSMGPKLPAGLSCSPELPPGDSWVDHEESTLRKGRFTEEWIIRDAKGARGRASSRS
jgi:hypothetical protein